MKTTVQTTSTELFFSRGRALARRADHRKRISPRRVLSFEDPADMLAVLTPRRIALFVAAKSTPGSIRELATRLGRSPSAIRRDVNALAHLGVLLVEPLAGDGMRIRAGATELRCICVVR
jgi:predicted transcriptional regulator